jgi:hypothetical protein
LNGREDEEEWTLQCLVSCVKAVLMFAGVVWQSNWLCHIFSASLAPFSMTQFVLSYGFGKTYSPGLWHTLPSPTKE